MKKYNTFIWLALVIMLFTSCSGNTPKTAANTETRTSGTINIAVDESYKPVMQQEINVFDSSNPNATIKVQYLPESACLNELFKGNVMLAMVSREPSEAETKAAEGKNVFLRSVAVAEDAIAIVVNNNSQDSLMTVDQLKSILTGKFIRKYNVVVDNNQGSIARYITDSLIPGQQLSTQLYAAKDNEEVMKYVSENPGSLGLVGVSHVFDKNSTVGYGAFRKDVRVVSLRNDSTWKFYQPYQASIALKDYPLTRKLYFIANQSSELSAGFANFLTSEPGQLIFSKAMLLPLNMQLIIREAEIKP